MDKDGFIHRSWMKSQGLPDHVLTVDQLSEYVTPGQSLPLAMLA